jgi:molybdopterin/thiamine biosynthesis adenylyltransferase
MTPASPDYKRQTDWYDPRVHEGSVTMIGCGGIGSAAAIALAKLGIPRMRLIDHDTVEPHNLPNQMYDIADVGKPKVEALADRLVAMRGDTLDLTPEVARITEGSEWKPSGIVVSGLDSMEARNTIWREFIRKNVNVSLYIDARLGGEKIVLYAINPMEKGGIDLYEETLYSDEDAKEDPCSRRSIIDVGFSTAALITRAVRKHLTGEMVEPILVHNQETFISIKAEPEAVKI